ncbi:MAG TPA: hypothetical protein VFD03_01435 [Clostridia bacterium]|nr:hypothetical protein [Clostridia bacterium]
MAHSVKCEIKCSKHNIWFPSPINFGNDEDFDETKLWGNRVECPVGREIISCNKENMRFDYRDDGGKVIHEEGQDTL